AGVANVTAATGSLRATGSSTLRGQDGGRQPGRHQVSDDLADWLAAQGLDPAALKPLPLAAGVTAVGFWSAGDEAVGWWRLLRAVQGRTGFWPVLVPSGDEAVRASGTDAGPAQRLARAADLDGAELLSPKGTFESLEDQVQQGMLA